MQKGNLSRLSGVIVLGGTCLLLGCGGSETAVASTAFPNLLLWDRGADGKYTIDVCFRKARLAQNDTPNWEGDKARATSKLQQTWMAHSGVNFKFSSSDCAATVPATWMPIVLRYDSSNPRQFWGWGAPGKGGRGTDPTLPDTQVVVNYGSNYYAFDTEVVHEVGHALGLAHERDRPDFTGCIVLNYPPCYKDSDCDGDITRCDTATHQCWVVRTPNAAPPLLTAAWDPFSVMANWECDVTRMHKNDYWELSAGDKLGINMLYPKQFDRGAGSVMSPVGFHTAAGLVIRNDGSIVTDWIAQGSHQDSASTPLWRVKGVSAGYSAKLSASVLSPGANTVQFSFADAVAIPKGRQHTGTDTVIVDSNLHAALASLAVFAYN